VKKHAISAALAVAALGVFVLWAQDPTAPAGVQAKSKKKKGPPQGPTPRLPDGHVDLSGVWNGGGPVGDLAQGMPKGEAVPLSAEGLKVMNSRQSKDDPEANCLPTGIPRIAPYPWRIVSDSTHLYFLFEGNIHSFRQVFTDGRKHPSAEDLDPTWYGHSIGSWDGDTMVIDTVGFNDKFWFDFRGHPHTEKLHTVERYTRLNLGQLKVETTIDDPVYYTKPFTVTFMATLRPGEELMEYICQENQQDASHLQGPAGTPARP
jgi:hypothetical protein